MILDLSDFRKEDLLPLIEKAAPVKKTVPFEGESVLILEPFQENVRAKLELSITACKLLGINPEEINSNNKVGVDINKTPDGNNIVISKGSMFNVGKNRKFITSPYYIELVNFFNLKDNFSPYYIELVKNFNLKDNLVLSLHPTTLEGVLHITNYAIEEVVEEVAFETNVPEFLIPEYDSEEQVYEDLVYTR